jgi:hypothetical protein
MLVRYVPPMGRFLYKLVDTVIVILCLPFYAVATPLMLLYEFTIPRVRTVRPGQVLQRWQRPDVREELRVVDVSRLDQGIVGVQRRVWNVLYGESPPAFPEAVEYCKVSEFWFGSLRLLRRGT